MEILRGEFVTYFLPIQHAAAHWASRVVSVSIWLCKRWIHEASENVADQSCIFLKINIYTYIREKKTAKKNTKKKVLSTLKENRNSVSCVSFSSKKNANWSLIFAQCRASEFGQENFCRHLFYQGNPLYNGDLLVLYLDKNRNFIRTISGPRLNDDLLIFPYIYICVWCWFMGMRSYWWYFRDPAPPGM